MSILVPHLQIFAQEVTERASRTEAVTGSTNLATVLVVMSLLVIATNTTKLFLHLKPTK